VVWNWSMIFAYIYIYILGIIIDQNIIWYFRDVITCDIPMGIQWDWGYGEPDAC
jgi:hypothetical protein